MKPSRSDHRGLPGVHTRVADSPIRIESKFTKSGTNRQTENGGLAVLLKDGRFQVVTLDLKRDIARRLGIYDEFGTNAFDAVMTTPGVEPLSALNLDERIGDLGLSK